MKRLHSPGKCAVQREEAIAWLRSVGRNASARDWSLGESILITMGEPTVEAGITMYPGVVYLYPVASGRWELIDCGLPDAAETYADLESAMRGAHEYVARRERGLVNG